MQGCVRSRIRNHSTGPHRRFVLLWKMRVDPVGSGCGDGSSVGPAAVLVGVGVAVASRVSITVGSADGESMIDASRVAAVQRETERRRNLDLPQSGEMTHGNDLSLPLRKRTQGVREGHSERCDSSASTAGDAPKRRGRRFCT